MKIFILMENVYGNNRFIIATILKLVCLLSIQKTNTDDIWIPK